MKAFIKKIFPRLLKISILIISFLWMTSAIGQVKEIAFLGLYKSEIKAKLNASTFITKIEEKVTDNGIPYYWCETQGSWMCGYNFNENGKCFQFSIMDSPETANGWRKILNESLTYTTSDSWEDRSQSSTIFWKLVLFEKSVWIQASFKSQ